jgi:peroxiredoxin
VEENRTFAEAEGFPFRLLSDTEKKAGALYDTIRSPDEPFYEYVPRRYSYLIEPDGTIVKAYDVTDVNAHADEVLSDLVALR